MKYIGNYYSWIDPLWEHLILTRDGQARPRDWPPATAVESAEYSKYEQAGYDLNAVNWWVYEYGDIYINLVPPWTTGKIHWWFTKMMPGQFMPMHTDPHTHGNPCNRYWMPLQDYIPGHVFIYNKEMILNYKAGDVFMFNEETDQHGAANIAHTPRIMLLITEYK
jgi:hypothetical protein